MTYVFRLLKKIVIFFGGLFPCTLVLWLLQLAMRIFPLGNDVRALAAAVATGLLLGAVLYCSGKTEGRWDTRQNQFSFVRGPVMTVATVLFFSSFHADGLILTTFAFGAAGDIAGYFTGRYQWLRQKSFVICSEELTQTALPAPVLEGEPEPAAQETVLDKGMKG